MIETLEERFHAKYVKRGEDECWPWYGAKNDKGRGQLYVSGGNGIPRINKSASRLAYELYHNIILSDDIKVLHTCDNPSCVNPKHLFTGTQKDNVEDMVKKG